MGSVNTVNDCGFYVFSTHPPAPSLLRKEGVFFIFSFFKNPLYVVERVVEQRDDRVSQICGRVVFKELAVYCRGC